ncbi:hypothetical protein HYDPIDRAFT_172255 [Hydnomerulius pinastri MD-312]|nr:hypothetical protein HYDPIDRAFT_172255 [Hydnomerulius pinastri MD-312]
MSRHRLVRNMNLHDELDDDALSDGGDDMTEEQHAQMESGLEHIRAVMGDEAASGLDDEIIKDTLWQFYFDIEQSIGWLYEEQERRAAAKERKGRCISSHLSPPLLWMKKTRPGHFGSPHYPAGAAGYYSEDMERPRVPLIVLAQQGQYQPDYYPAPEFVEYDEEMDHDDVPLGMMSPGDRNSRLSTITELTERTEPSRHWPSRQQLVAMNNPRALSSSEITSSYGQVIDRHSRTSQSVDDQLPAVDPNDIPPSPSPSAVQRLSIYSSAPSALTRTESDAPTERPKSPPRAPSISLPPTENMGDIPDFMSKSSMKPPVPPEKDFPTPPKRSKLAALASTRASTISSSRSSDLETTSVLTYPALRPSAESRLSLASRATSSSPSIKPPSTTTSSMSSHVRRAIQAAMELEANEKEIAPKKRAESVVSETSSASTAKPSKPLSPTSPPRSAVIPEVPVSPDSKARPQSKLAKLAQAKASNNAVVPRIPKSIPPSSPPKELPKPHTEYFTPIANGATATTAITTSYQSLHSLSTSRAQDPFPFVQMPGTETRQSKLALKVKKAQDKSSSHSSATDDEGSLPSPPPLFLPKSSRSHKDKHSRMPKYGREELNLVDMYQASISQSKSTLGLELQQQQMRSRTKPPASPDLSVRSGSFAFDVPSPDDIVFSARRGTSLAQRR